jgi:hypothetical protein
MRETPPPDDPSPAAGDAPSQPPPASGPDAADAERERGERGLSDLFRRAVAAGFDFAGRSKDDILRAAAGEVRTWLDHLDLDAELAKALTRVVLEVKAEIRFRPTEDGKIEPTAETDVKVRTQS